MSEKNCLNCKFFVKSWISKLLNRCSHPNTKMFIRNEVYVLNINGKCGANFNLHQPKELIDSNNYANGQWKN